MGDYQLEQCNRFYTKYETLKVEEDLCHEFKCHRNMCVEELPPWGFIPGTDKRSRRAISRTLCGFLNTGQGGVVYLGVTDEGVVRGLTLTNFQKDHAVLSVYDVLSRYQPPVSRDMVKVSFVLVVPKFESFKEYREKVAERGTKQSERLRSHTLRTYINCWCDEEAICRRQLKWLAAYVIEITILPWKVPPPRILLSAEENWPSMKDMFYCDLTPIYEDEEGKCYFRYHSSMKQVSGSDVLAITQQELSTFYEPIIESLRQHLLDARFHLEV